MGVRKEQVLLLLTLAAGVLYWRSLDAGGARVAFVPTVLGYDPKPGKAVPLVGDAAGGLALRPLFTEPSETQALPPRELPFPDRAPLSIVALPLDPGPDLGHATMLALPGTVVADVSLQGGGEAGGDTVPEAAPEVAETTQQKIRRWQRVYDSVWRQNLATPLLGRVEAEGKDPFDLEDPRNLTGTAIRLHMFSVEREQMLGVQTFAAGEVTQVLLAQNLRNEVKRRTRAIPKGSGRLVDRGNLIAWLLQMARQDATVYEDAKAQADLFLADAGGDIEGLQWKLRVLRAMGDIEGEFALLSGIEGRYQGSAFQLEGLGLLKQKLGLWQEAEQDLRRATAIAAMDPRPHAALAGFLVARGRADEAVPAARRALTGLGTVTVDAERRRVVVAAAATLLAVGDLTGARAAIADMPAPAVAFVRASIDYAAGDVRSALEGFREAVDSVDGQAAQLGAAACLLRLEQWQEALTAFEGVAQQAPLLRHRAWTGIALLHLRLGQYDQCVSWVERALEAAPNDPYALYLRGRAQRLLGQLQPAQESIAAVLRQRDDFVHAVAEMSLTHAATATGLRGAEQASAALAAMRYADRAVDLGREPLLELRELQGLRRFEAADLRAAEQAFAAARDAAQNDEQKLYARGCLAVVDYSLGRQDDALDKLRVLLELPREHVLRKWAEATQALIDDHSQKEMLQDRFARGELGKIWGGDRDAGLGPEIAGEALVLAGEWSKGEVSADRLEAVTRAGRFLACAVTMQVGSGHRLTESFSGLRLQTPRGGGGQGECEIMLGLRDGVPFVRIAEGREEPVMKALGVDGLDVNAPQRLELRVELADANARFFRLVCRWNDQVVHVAGLKVLSANNNSPLATQLVAIGPRGSRCNVKFDDYQLERRKEAK